MDDQFDLIEAFADGEAVDPDRLRRALADPRAREHLLEVLSLRALVGSGAMPHLSTSDAHTAPRRRGVWMRWLPAAAAAVVVSVLAGYLAGTRVGRSTIDDASARVARLGVGVPVSPPAPAPTHVIHLQNGVDWTEQSGGGQ